MNWRGIIRYFTGPFAAIRPGVWYVLLIASVLSVIQVFTSLYHYSYGWLHYAGVIAFIMFKATAVAYVLEFTRRYAWLYAPTAVFVGAFVLLSVVNGVSFLIYGVAISHQFVAVIYETNPREVFGFMPSLMANLRAWIFGVKGLAAIAVAVAVWFAITKLPKRWFQGLMIASVVSGAGYMWYVNASLYWMQQHLITYNTYIRLRITSHQLHRLAEMIPEGRKLPWGDELRSECAARKVVLVLGESSTKRHWSLWGYPLPTTPKANAMCDSLMIFEGALAPNNYTADVVPRILTTLGDSTVIDSCIHKPSLMMIFRELGYNTRWLSVQERTGTWSNLSTILAIDCNELSYLGSYDSNDIAWSRYDEVLVEPYRGHYSSTSDSLQLICMHLMGSHGRYRSRYPRGFSRFDADAVLSVAKPGEWVTRKQAETIAGYDNSIAYTDSLLAEFIAPVARDPEPALLVYVSDHGENVYDTHDYVGRDYSRHCINVPFIIYANRAYREANPDMMERMARARNRRFSSANLIHMLLTLTRTDYPLYNGEADPLADTFTAPPVYVDGKIFKDF